jgi:hypothetical protein
MRVTLTTTFAVVLFFLNASTLSTKAVTVFDDPLPVGAAIQIFNPKNHVCIGAQSQERLEQATKLLEQGGDAAETVMANMIVKGWIVPIESGSTGKVLRADEEENEYLVKLAGRDKPLWVNGEVVEKAHP